MICLLKGMRRLFCDGELELLCYSYECGSDCVYYSILRMKILPDCGLDSAREVTGFLTFISLLFRLGTVAYYTLLYVYSAIPRIASGFFFIKCMN